MPTLLKQEDLKKICKPKWDVKMCMRSSVYILSMPQCWNRELLDAFIVMPAWVIKKAEELKLGGRQEKDVRSDKGMMSIVSL